MRRIAIIVALTAAGLVLAPSSSRAHAGVWLTGPDFVAAAHARYEEFILARGARRIETGQIVRQARGRRALTTPKRKRSHR